MQKKYAWLMKAALQLKGVKINYKDEWQAYQFLISDKMFAYLGTNNHQQEIVTLKGDPLMIEIYDCVTEGYYMNKIHWISIILDDPKSPTHELVIDQLQKAYQLVFNKLPKKTQQQISQ